MDLKRILQELRAEYSRVHGVIAALERLPGAVPVAYTPRIVVKRRGRPRKTAIPPPTVPESCAQ